MQRHFRGLHLNYGAFMTNLQENFEYSNESIDKLEKRISRDRLSPYLKIEKYDSKNALKLYVKNTLLSESFYPLIQALEVCFRNSGGSLQWNGKST